MTQAKVYFSSRIANDPELRYTQSGSSFLSLRFAHNAGYKNRQTGEWVDTSTTWCSTTFWGDDAERVLAMEPRKGYVIMGSGNLDGIDTYQPTGGGEVRTTLNVKAWANDLAITPPPARDRHQPSGGGGGGRQQQGPQHYSAPAEPIQEGAPANLQPADNFEEGEDLPW